MNYILQSAGYVRDTLVGLPRTAKKFVALSADFIGFLGCALLAEWLLLGSDFRLTPNLLLASCLTAFIVPAICWTQGLYRSIVRFIGLGLFIVGLKAAVAAGLAGVIAANLFNFVPSPTRWSVVLAGASFAYFVTSRMLARAFLIRRRSRVSRDRVIIYGAGMAGAQLSTGLLSGDKFLPVAFVDDDPRVHGNTVNGLVVYAPSEIATIIDETGASRILLAIPSASMRRRREVIEHVSEFHLRVQTMPGLEKIVSGEAKVDAIRGVNVKDLLGRDPVPPKPELLSGAVTGKNVFVSGAGGSIGSELCRQFVNLQPDRLVLFEISEFALYAIERELLKAQEAAKIDFEIVSILGSVNHRERIDEVLEAFDVQTIFHAAAYKHVPIVEQNLLEGVENNVFGTLQLAEAAAAARVEKFVLISTDKAVSPTSVMGATKRISELILQALQDDCRDTCFCMVRFGNVLDSSGSVVPLFKEQIRAGGPVTVTHRDIVRYFMTIPEAAELVIQAATMAKGGEVFVLDMGEPVRILDLATKMIRLMGFKVCDEKNPDGDISIEFSGLRPAEKLYEELLIGNNVSGTDHPRILRANEEKIPLEPLNNMLAELNRAVEQQDRELARELLKQMVVGYKPESGIVDHVWRNTPKGQPDDRSSAVVEFRKLPS
jgi:FlaA1/EpsC-like NDP-sugar epimerase